MMYMGTESGARKDSRRVVNTKDNLSKDQDLTPETLYIVYPKDSLILMDQEEMTETTAVAIDHDHVM